MRQSLPITLISILLVVGCSTSHPMYHWGSYESLLYQMYVEPGKATPEVQIQKLTRDIQRAESTGKKVPPGVYAHLGFMYSLAGNPLSARQAFNEELALFPESKVLIDGFIQRMEMHKPNTTREQ